MSKRTMVMTTVLFQFICLERLIQFLNLLRFRNLGFANEYVIKQILIFFYDFMPVLVLVPAVIFLLLNLKRDKLYALLPLGVTILTLWFFSNFSFFKSYVEVSFATKLHKFEEVVELVKADKLELVESYPMFRSSYKDYYSIYGDVMICIHKLPRKYRALARDNMSESNIMVFRSEKKGLIQVDFPINGIRYAYIYTEDGELFKWDIKYHTIEKKDSHWYYVVYQ